MPDANTAESTARASGSTLQIKGDRMIKRQSPKHSRLERERTQFGARVAAESGLFEVPDILSYEDEEGEITFRYDHGAVPLREYLVKRREPELMKRAGRALAAIHDAGVISDGSDVFWHGDYGLVNVLYSEARDRIMIVDWANAKWAFEPAERSSGSAGMDLGIALISLFHYRLLGPMYIPKPETLASALLRAYIQERGRFSMEAICPFISQLIHRRRRFWVVQHGILKTLASDLSLVRLRLFLSKIHSRLE